MLYKTNCEIFKSILSWDWCSAASGPDGARAQAGEYGAAVSQAWWNKGTDYFLFPDLEKRVRDVFLAEKKKDCLLCSISTGVGTRTICVFDSSHIYREAYPRCARHESRSRIVSHRQTSERANPWLWKIPDVDLIWTSWFKLIACTESAAGKSPVFANTYTLYWSLCTLSQSPNNGVKQAIKCVLSILQRTRF